MNRERLTAARRDFGDWLELVDREQEALTAILEGLDDLLELDRERAMAAELAEEMTPPAAPALPKETCEEVPPEPVKVEVGAELEASQLFGISVVTDPEMPEGVIELRQAGPSRCETCNHTAGSHEAAGGGCRSGQCSCEAFVGAPQVRDSRWINGSTGTAQCTLCQRTMGYRLKWAHESVCTPERPLAPSPEAAPVEETKAAPRKPDLKPGGCYRCHHAPGSHGSHGRGRCSSPNCECAWFAPTANDLEVDPRGYTPVGPGTVKCLECGFEAGNAHISRHMEGHKAQAAVAEKRANGEHIHRWKLDPPKGEFVHQECACGATKDVPAMLGEIGRGTRASQ